MRIGFPKFPIRLNRCMMEKKYLIVGGSNGVDADRNEFRHMALLGYVKANSTEEWLCGGSIISERFILTAGHCVYSPFAGKVTRAATGILMKSEVKSSTTKIYNIKNIIKHPQFKPPSKYNDIALLETQEEIQLNMYTVPACLHTGKYSDRAGEAIATGWGVLWYRGDLAEVLQKMTLKEFSNDSCRQLYQKHRRLPQGFDDQTQLCYGDPILNTDTCEGDSGGPLQILHPDMECMHLVVGVTSFGNPCGRVNQPAVYTRVDSYVPWIESVVWPRG